MQLNLTYASLCALTREYVSTEGVANAMCARLEAAQRAEERGQTSQKERALRQYVQHVEQAEKTGKLTTAEAEHLLALVSTL